MHTQPATGLIKYLTSKYPQDFVSWLLPDAQFQAAKTPQLPGPDSESDALLSITQQQQEKLLHIRELVDDEANIATQLVEYRASVQKHCGLSPITYIICLRPVNALATLESTEKGEQQQRFDYYVRKMWEVPSSELLEMKLAGLLPLLPLTRQGHQRDTIDQMIEAMILARQFDLIPLGEVAAGLVVHNEADRIWLKRRFAMYRTSFKFQS